MLRVETNNLAKFVTEDEVKNIKPQLELAAQQLRTRISPGNDFLGWLDWPCDLEAVELERIKAAADEIRTQCEVFVVIGIGGSYLGAQAALSALGSTFPQLLNGAERGAPLVLFAGHHLSSRYMADLLDYLADKEVALNVISKSGTTTEPAIAFRLLRKFLVEKYGREEAMWRIYVTTDPNKGALRGFAATQGCTSFAVPSDIGGRYSVLTAVGLLPLAVAGVDVAALLAGAAAMRERLKDEKDDNPAYKYAAARNILLRKGYDIEILVSYEPGLYYLAEWWKQLFGESEGKNQRGIFPAAVNNSTDLHSMGQYIQEGRRALFETVLEIAEPGRDLSIPREDDDADQLNYLAERPLSEVNQGALEATVLAHVDGGVPNLRICLPKLDASTLGGLFYFFEYSCALSGLLNGVNPFDQPGVEAYKINMFALLGKPGYEAAGAELRNRLNGERV
ncbi:MAG: glucose-6-phosphate isomerase [Clostridiaceae bacterium]|nr:glucose-6-phosphate isomerase [Clostridiaceae bacterium]